MQFIKELFDTQLTEILFSIFLIFLGFIVYKFRSNIDDLAIYQINKLLKLFSKKQLEENYFEDLLFNLKSGYLKVEDALGKEVFKELKGLVKQALDTFDDNVIKEYNEKHRTSYKTLTEVLADVLDRKTDLTYEQCLRIINVIIDKLK